MSKDKRKIIVFDIETLPILSRVMEHFCGLSDYPGKTLKADINSIITIAWKVVGSPRVNCIKAWDFPAWKRDVNCDKKVVEAFAKVLAEADAMVTHNGKRFDLKVLNTRLLKNGFDPIPKIPHIDTCAVARSNTSFINNRLNTISKSLGLEGKLENGGWQLWVDVLNKKASALKLMEKYNKQDVVATEEVFLRLRPFVNNIPNYNVYNPKDGCPNCGGMTIHKHGYAATKTKKYTRYKCQDCGSTFRTDAKDQNPRSL